MSTFTFNGNSNIKLINNFIVKKHHILLAKIVMELKLETTNNFFNKLDTKTQKK